MKMRNLFLTLSAALVLSTQAFADSMNHVEELNPYAPDINEQLLENEGFVPMDDIFSMFSSLQGNCYRETCDVFIEVDRTRQRGTIRINGEILMDKSGSLKNGEVRVTTGSPGHATPLFDRTFQVPMRIYNKYSSSKYPGGDWQGYGNMPFAIFIKGGFAVHGTTGGDTWGNISKLGTKPLSHGCVRLHPLNAKALNEAVRKVGSQNAWIWVHD